MRTRPKHLVTETPAAASAAALRHFTARLAFETDPADVHADLAAHGVDGTSFVLVDTRRRADYDREHLPGALSLPSATITATTIGGLPPGRTVVTYCWSVHCNGSTRGAARLAALGVPVKEMLGGIEAWKREGFATVTAEVRSELQG